MAKFPTDLLTDLKEDGDHQGWAWDSEVPATLVGVRLFAVTRFAQRQNGGFAVEAPGSKALANSVIRLVTDFINKGLKTVLSVEQVKGAAPNTLDLTFYIKDAEQMEAFVVALKALPKWPGHTPALIVRQFS